MCAYMEHSTATSPAHSPHSFFRTLQRTKLDTDEVKRLVGERRIVFYRRDLKFADRAHWIFWSAPNGCAARAVLTTDFRNIVTVMSFDRGVAAVEPLVPLARQLAENPTTATVMSDLNGETSVPVRLVVRPKSAWSPSVVSARVSVRHLASENVLSDRAFLREVARANPTLLPALVYQAVFVTREEGGGTISSHVSVPGAALWPERPWR